MAGNYLSAIVLLNAWQDTVGGDTAAPLIKPTQARFLNRRTGGRRVGEETRENETGKTGRGKLSWGLWFYDSC